MSKLPDNAKKVFDGVLYDVWQWEQELFDGTTTTFEMLVRQPMADVIAVVEEGRLLVLRERQPGTKWFPSLPGGHIDPGEEPLPAAQRELLEETGYMAHEWKLLERYDHPGNVHAPISVYIARAINKVKAIDEDPGEEITVKEIAFDDFLLLAKDPLFNAPFQLKMRMLEALYNKDVYQVFYEEVFLK